MFRPLNNLDQESTCMSSHSFSDSSFFLIARALKDIELPEYAKLADVFAPSASANRHGFAMPSSSQLPCNTKVACYLSHAYYYAQRDLVSPDDQPEVESKLAEFANLHRINTDVQALAQYPGWSSEEKLAETPMDLRDVSDLSPMDLIEFARSDDEQSKTASGLDCKRWSFTRQHKDLPRQLKHLAETEDNEAYAKLASAIEFHSPRRINEELPVIAEAMREICGDTEEVFNKLSLWPTHLDPVVRIGFATYDREDVESKLAGIDGVLGGDSGLINRPVLFPASDWECTIERLTGPRAQQAIAYLTGQKIAAIA